MMSTTKTLIPEKEWLIKNGKDKIGSISKEKKSFYLLRKGSKIKFHSLSEIKSQLGIEISENLTKSPKLSTSNTDHYSIYDYPCSSKPYESTYNLRKHLPLFAKSSKSKSQYCAGHYLIKFRKGWVKSFCPKLITLERYSYHGPFKNENDLKQILSNITKCQVSADQ